MKTRDKRQWRQCNTGRM